MKNKQTTRKVRDKITFEDYNDRMAIVLAQLGQSNKSILFQTEGLTNGKIHYRLSKYKRYSKDKAGLRSQWRDGDSPLFTQVLKDVSGILAKDIQQHIVPLIVHPEPETVKV